MADAKVNDKHKDALFRIVFGEHPENALSLYNAINGSDYSNVEDLSITTLEDAIYIGVKNDVSFLFNHEMSLYEHQATFSPNLPLRGLGYFADLYKIHLGGGEIAKNRIYSRYKVKIPTPKYYIFYNGAEERPDKEDLFLSDLFDGDGDIEVTAHMLNVNYGHNKELLDRCRMLEEIAVFLKILRDYRDEGLSKEEAVARAIDDCIRDHVLEDILRKERARVENVLISGITDEELKELHDWEIEHSHELGVEEGFETGLSKGAEKGSEKRGYDDVDKIIAGGKYNAAEACELIEVDYNSYINWKSGNND